MAKLVVTLALFSAFLAIGYSANNVVCYFTNWTVYRPGKGKYNVSNIDPFLCTHIMYAFNGLNEDGSVWVLDDWEANGLEEVKNLVKLKHQNPNLKVVMSMGGWNEGSEKYSRVAADPKKRANLIQSVISYLDDNGFDGFDFDWEYPGQRHESNNPEEDKVNFITLLSELKAALSAKGKILTAAVSAGVKSIDISYDVKAVSDLLDLINVMAYDFHGAFEPFVGHHCPLYASHLDKTVEQQQLNVAAGVQHWIDLGADPSKIVLGVGAYGRSFTLDNVSNSELYAPTRGGGHAGPYTNFEGILGYNEICELYSHWKVINDDEQMVPHKIFEDQWVGYEDEHSIAIKVEFAKSLRLGGIMVWSLDTDDFLGNCGKGKYPLLTTINKVLNNVN